MKSKKAGRDTEECSEISFISFDHGELTVDIESRRLMGQLFWQSDFDLTPLTMDQD